MCGRLSTKRCIEREKKIADGLLAAERGQRELIEADRQAAVIIQEAKQEAPYH